jgi:hypothetical protein
MGDEGAAGAVRLAAYVRRAAGQLDAAPGAQFLRGGLVFPIPAPFLPPMPIQPGLMTLRIST